VLDLESSDAPLAAGADEGDQPGGTSPFGAWVAHTRQGEGLTVQELSTKSGLSVPAIYGIESGRTQNPQQTTRRRLTAALGREPSQETVDVTGNDARIPDVGVLTDFDPHDARDLPVEPG
jgi:transcriptional regulator with XRE-family HTH domain